MSGRGEHYTDRQDRREHNEELVRRGKMLFYIDFKYQLIQN